MYRKKSDILYFVIVLFIGTFFFFSFSFSLYSYPSISIFAFQEKEQKKKEKQKQKVITEEIVVEAELPKELPISTKSSIKKEKIESLAPRDLSEVMSYTSGTFQGRKHAKTDQICLFLPYLTWPALVMAINSLQRD